MKERPILFSGEMVRAILDCEKMQTRRVIKPQPHLVTDREPGTRIVWKTSSTEMPCPYGQPGDRLWVRETGWERPVRTERMMINGADTWDPYYYDADLSSSEHEQFKGWGFKRRPSIYMPRWASRITLEVTDVRVERLHDISEEDALAEGIKPVSFGVNDNGFEWSPVENGTYTAKEAFMCLWDSINGKPRKDGVDISWAANSWVWVVSFQTLEETGAKVPTLGKV